MKRKLARLRVVWTILAASMVLAGPAPRAAGQDDDAELREIEEMVRKRTEDPLKYQGEKEIEKLKKDYGEDLFTFFFDDGVVPRPYLIGAQLQENTDPETVAKQYAQIVGYLQEQFFREYGEMLELEPIDSPVVVLVFGGVDKYLEVVQANPKLGLIYFPGLGGYFNPETELLYMWEQPDLWGVMFHEGTHQLMHHATKKWKVAHAAQNPWLQEGIAEYFGGHTKELVKKGDEWVYEFTYGGIQGGRYNSLRKAYYEGSALTARELVYFDRGQFNQARTQSLTGDMEAANKVQMVYAMGWALVMFLNKAEDGRYEPAFRKILKAENEGRLTGDLFGETLVLEDEYDWADFDEEFRNWVLTDLGKLRLRGR